MEVSNIQVYNMYESMVASGFPMRTDTDYFAQEIHDMYYDDQSIINNHNFTRMCNLGGTKLNSGHANALSGILVSFNVKASNAWMVQFERYHFAQIVSSQSKMHKLKSMNIDECCNNFVDPRIKEIMKEYQSKYNCNQCTIEDLIYNCPMGFELTMHVVTNYLQLANIYFQRKDHRLREWQAFCAVIRSLPNFDAFVFSERDKKDN